ncbi:hypothetical protein QBC41DRAFT_13984 [Cercophora samala]|uniref:Uncharacterized protein n=1 Tax=Cercophora samala TaxID=330535 RepID=A0AA39ZKG2_9PEZI|nr:hypothetical protein QBC41DRAFT_13984 [Cercophora samala]
MTTLRRKKHYFLTPVPETPPDGPIQLGSIISHPELAFEPVNRHPVSPDSRGEKVYVNTSTPHTVTVGKTKSQNLGLFAELPSIINSVLGYEWATSDTETWAFRELHTIWFTPSIEYIHQSLADAQVQQFVRDNKSWLGGINLYMVTGIKVAYGASMLSEFARLYGFNGTLGMDLSAVGAPISVGPETGLEKSSILSASFNSVDPVVFAFRLRRIKIRASGKFKHADYTKDALLGIKDQDNEVISFGTDGLEDEDVTGLEFDLENGEVLDDARVDEEERGSSFSYCTSA